MSGTNITTSFTNEEMEILKSLIELSKKRLQDKGNYVDALFDNLMVERIVDALVEQKSPLNYQMALTKAYEALEPDGKQTFQAFLVRMNQDLLKIDTQFQGNLDIAKHNKAMSDRIFAEINIPPIGNEKPLHSSYTVAKTVGDIKFITDIEKLSDNLKKATQGKSNFDSIILADIAARLKEQPSPLNLTKAFIETYEFVSPQVPADQVSKAFELIVPELKKLDSKGVLKVEKSYTELLADIQAKNEKVQKLREASLSKTKKEKENDPSVVLVPPPDLPQPPPMPTKVGTPTPLSGQPPITSAPPPPSNVPPPPTLVTPPTLGKSTLARSPLPPTPLSGPSPINLSPSVNPVPMEQVEAPQPTPDILQITISRFDKLISYLDAASKISDLATNNDEAAIIQRQALMIFEDLKKLQKIVKDQNLAPQEMQKRLGNYLNFINDSAQMHPQIKVTALQSDRKIITLDNQDDLVKKHGFSDIHQTTIGDDGETEETINKPGKVYTELLDTEVNYINFLNQLDNVQQKIILNKLDKYELEHPEDQGKYLTANDMAQWFSALEKIKAAQNGVLDAFINSPPNEWGKALNAVSEAYAEYGVIFKDKLKMPPPPGVNLNNSELGRPLEQFLIMPVQRLPRYELLSRDLLKQLNPGHQHEANLKSFIHDAGKVTTKMDARVGVYEIHSDLLMLAKERQDRIATPKSKKSINKAQLQGEIAVLETIAKHFKDKNNEKDFTLAVVLAYQEFEKNGNSAQFVEFFTRLAEPLRELERHHKFKFSHNDAIVAISNIIKEEINVSKRRNSEPIPKPSTTAESKPRSLSSPPSASAQAQTQNAPPSLQAQETAPLLTAQSPAPIIRQMRTGPVQSVMLETQSQDPANPPTIQDIHAKLQAKGVQQITKYLAVGNQLTKLTDDAAKFDTIGVEIRLSNVRSTQYFIQTNNNGVTYSLNSNLSPTERDACLLKTCKDLVETLTPDKVINLTGVANKEATHQALHQALSDKYGADYVSNPAAPKIIGVEPMKAEPAKPKPQAQA